MRSRRAKLGGAVGAALAAAGAAWGVGCAYQPPPTQAEILARTGTLASMDLNSPWREGEQGAPVGPVADDWLATFGDAELNALVAEAMVNNPDLRVTAARVEIAAQHVVLAKAEMLPSVNVFGTGGLNMGGGDISSALQGISLGAAWEPDLWGRMRYGRNAAQENHASVRADHEFGRQSLAATIAKGWFAASETALELEIVEEMAGLAEELVTLADQRQTVGPGNEQDVLVAKGHVATLRDSAMRLRHAHEEALRALELLVGRYPSAELAARTDLARLPGPVPAGLPIEMLERRPDMVAAERRVAAAFNRVGEAKAARLPRVILNANVAIIESNILDLKEDFENPTGGAGLKLIAPIYQGGKLNAELMIRTLEQHEAIAQYARTALRALGDVESALAAGRTLEEREALLGRVVVGQERVVELAQTNYRVGLGDLRAVQQQQVGLLSLRLTLLRVRSERLAQRVNLHLALGGSFEAPVADEPVDEKGWKAGARADAEEKP